MRVATFEQVPLFSAPTGLRVCRPKWRRCRDCGIAELQLLRELRYSFTSPLLVTTCARPCDGNGRVPYARCRLRGRRQRPAVVFWRFGLIHRDRVLGRCVRQTREIPDASREAAMELATTDLPCPEADESPGQHGRICPRRSLRYRNPVHVQSASSLVDTRNAQCFPREANPDDEQSWRSRDGKRETSAFLLQCRHKLCYRETAR